VRRFIAAFFLNQLPMQRSNESGSAAIQGGEESPHSKGRVCLIVAALLWSLSGVVIKSPVIQAIPVEDRSLVLACYRALFAAAGLLPFVAWRRVRLTPRLMPSVVSFAVMNLLFVNAFTRTTAGAASCLQYTSTAWVFLFGWLVLKEQIHRGNIVALACAGCGIAWILFSEQDDQHADGNLFALGSGIAYAGVILLLRWLRHEDATWVTVLNHAFSGLVLLPLVFSRHIELTALQWSLVVFLGVFQMGLPYALATRGVAVLSVQESALLVLLEPILVPLWAWLCWGEQIGWPTLIGGGLIVGGLALRYAAWPDRVQPQP
jgi:drug/metabolite transporter (DMT)-like permease